MIKMLDENLIFSWIIWSFFQSFLIVFVDCVDYQIYTSIWHHAHKIMLMLFSFIHIMHLLSLHSVLLIVKLNQIENSSAVLHQTIEIYFQNKIFTLFMKLYLLYIYEKQIRKHFFSCFIVIWLTDMQTLIFKKNVLKITNLNNMMQQFIINIKIFFCEQLIFQNCKYLKIKQFCELIDD